MHGFTGEALSLHTLDKDPSYYHVKIKYQDRYVTALVSKPGHSDTHEWPIHSATSPVRFNTS